MPEQLEATEGIKMRGQPGKPEYEGLTLTSFEAYELAEITAELDRVNRMHDAAQRRMDNLARSVLTRGQGVGSALQQDLSAWSFYIDAKGKRVVIRREVEPEPKDDNPDLSDEDALFEELPDPGATPVPSQPQEAEK